jgi:hypothetical protein
MKFGSTTWSWLPLASTVSEPKCEGVDAESFAQGRLAPRNSCAADDREQVGLGDDSEQV